ncbi:hypothetical protein FB451DRAFT_1549643 [Mycena latifolia]|nr:hypothetical protein FB451DRAFT_1549643 [Mycena latifolia]
MAALLSGLPVQEVWDQIIDHLRGYRDLRSCALVSRAFTPRAQYHLFYNIVFQRPQAGSDSFSPYDEVAFCRRLVSILAVSSHLKPHIRCIRIPFCTDILACVDGMRLPRLREISFIECPSTHVASTADPFSTTLDLAHGLIALPSIRSVEIDVEEWPTAAAEQWFLNSVGPRFVSRAMARLFQKSTPHIEALVVRFAANSDELHEDSATHELALNACTNEATIKILGIWFSPEMEEFFAHPECPFDFSQLADVEIVHSMTPAIGKALEHGRFTIQRLKCWTKDLARGLRLQRFPSLTRFEIVAHAVDFPDITDAISNVSGKCIETIIVRIIHHGGRFIEQSETGPFDTILSSPLMPALQKVEISFMPMDKTQEDYCSKRDILHSAFPKLYARGLLEVPTRFYRNVNEQ